MNNTLVVGVRVRALLNWQSLIDSKVENETNELSVPAIRQLFM